MNVQREYNNIDNQRFVIYQIPLTIPINSGTL